MVTLTPIHKSQLKQLCNSVYYEGLLALCSAMEAEINSSGTLGANEFETVVNSVRRDTGLSVLKDLLNNIEKQASI